MKSDLAEKLMIVLIVSLITGIFLTPVVFVISKIVVMLFSIGDIGKLAVFLTITIILQIVFGIILD